ncbi:MAG: c-type cytochrome [Chloroflexota bacterium]|nr:c-type cytochrome [Chloroflexota bacterium]MDE2909752.1 c-type cytochrome [Chloroflexota bacterium]
MINWRWERSTIRRTLCCAILLAGAALLAGCGTLAAPVMQVAPATTEVIVERQAEATATLAPSATPLPPTQTTAPTSTVTPTPMPTATPEPTSAPVLSPIERLVAVRDPFNGALLFGTFQDAANYACSNCHLSDSEKENLGPGLLNIKDRAATRVEGMSAAEYIYQSIVDSKSYTVEGFDPDLMPQNWAEIYSDLEIFDIVAYLMTLEGRSDINDPD